ncbi:hypothetical protein KI387_002986, partial [Taxus chinensis]
VKTKNLIPPSPPLAKGVLHNNEKGKKIVDAESLLSFGQTSHNTATHSGLKDQVMKHEERTKTMRKEITQLKEGPKGKSLDSNPMLEAKIEEISKKQGDLEESLGPIVNKQFDHLSMHKAFLEFIEIQVNHICNLINIPPGPWKGGK